MTSTKQDEPFHLLTDDEDLEELRSIGIDPTSDEALERVAAADLDSRISIVLRQLARVVADRERYEEAEAFEHRHVTMRYAKLRAPLLERETMLRRIGEGLAAMATFSGKAKSRATAYGSYGRRKKAAHVSIDDAKALLADALVRAPAIVETTTPEPISKVPQRAAAAFYAATKILLAGLTYTPESDEPFVAPDPIATEYNR